jgi:hypothetical protein
MPVVLQAASYPDDEAATYEKLEFRIQQGKHYTEYQLHACHRCLPLTDTVSSDQSFQPPTSYTITLQQQQEFVSMAACDCGAKPRSYCAAAAPGLFLVAVQSAGGSSGDQIVG